MPGKITVNRDIILAVQQLYISWRNKKSQCNRGVTLCDEWGEFLPFTRWSFKNGVAVGLNLYRQDSDGGFSPENCQYVTSAEQQQGRTINKLDIEKATIIRALIDEGNLYHREIGEIFGVSRITIRAIHYKKIWKVVELVERPDWRATDEEIICIKGLFVAWICMKSRIKPGYHCSQHYYTKGITICTAWTDDFTTFVNWSLANGYKPGLTLDRRNNDEGYFPWNSRWATRAEQQQNTSRTKLNAMSVILIKTLLDKGNLYQREIAMIFGVGRSRISAINTGRSWKMYGSVPVEIQG